MISRKTYQKELIQKEVEKFPNFFSTEDLYQKIIKKDNKIGIATLYRYLKEQKEKRKLHSFTCENKQVYSKTNNIHAHFICQNCGKIEHFQIKDLSQIKKSITGSICHMNLEVHGLCKKCISN